MKYDKTCFKTFKIKFLKDFSTRFCAKQSLTWTAAIFNFILRVKSIKAQMMATIGKDWCSTAFYSSFPLHCQRPTSSRVQHVQHQMHTYAHKHHTEHVQLMMSSALGQALASSAQSSNNEGG